MAKQVRYTIFSEWDLGMDMSGYRSISEAREALLDNPNFQDVMTDNNWSTIEEVETSGLISFNRN